MSAHTLLSRLEKVKSLGQNRWQACCPAHADRGPSLSVRELEDGRVLLHDFGGCSPADVLTAINLDFGDLFPEKLSSEFKRERRPFPAADILRCVAFEALVVATAGAAILAGERFTPEDRQRLVVAVARLQSALDAGGIDDAN